MRKPDYYILTPFTYKPAPRGHETIASAAVGYCGLCGAYVTGMDGDSDIVCTPCAENIIYRRDTSVPVGEKNDG